MTRGIKSKERWRFSYLVLRDHLGGPCGAKVLLEAPKNRLVDGVFLVVRVRRQRRPRQHVVLLSDEQGR
jgi:hypothetical protein